MLAWFRRKYRIYSCAVCGEFRCWFWSFECSVCKAKKKGKARHGK